MTTASAEEIQRNLSAVLEHIARAAAVTGRAPQDITLVAVTKTQPPEAVSAVLAAGASVVGENRVQEALAKQPQVRDTVDWHLIGRLQTNKAKFIPGRFAMVQSLDRLDLAEALERQCEKAGIVIPCLVEVNIGHEPQKGGVVPEDLERFLSPVVTLPHLAIEGLMTVVPQVEQPEEARPHFAAMRRLYEDVSSRVVPMRYLSMGMSHDYEVAISEGANMVRVGTAIFGRRV